MAHPDPSIISAFVDGEVPAPWSAGVSAHLDSCPACAARAARLREARAFLAASPEPDVELAREAVWARLAARSSEARKGGLWKLKLEIPLPLALAAALAVAVLGTLAASAFRENGQLRMAAFAAQEIQPALAEGTGFDSIIRYLEAQDASLSITIQLPPSAGQGLPAGKPVMMKSGSEEVYP
ncbi:MAG: zf-HC2 domain-containing protein [Spirochaetales bacterium]|nr:zf-HC2 domain-containing protein [Spirochaetales bacterium]